MLSVVIPVGPKPHHRQWLLETLSSIDEQTQPPDEVVLVNDGGPMLMKLGGLSRYTGDGIVDERSHPYRVVEYTLPWSVGPMAGFNIGIAVAQNNLVLMACGDDRLLPRCCQLVNEAYQREQYELGYYYLGVRYSQGHEDQNTACGAAAVTKALWRYTGGFPAQSAVGAGDHIFLSMLLGGSNRGVSQAKILRVSDEVLYWYRVHGDTQTSKNIWPAIEAVKSYFTETWVPNDTAV